MKFDKILKKVRVRNIGKVKLPLFSAYVLNINKISCIKITAKYHCKKKCTTLI